MARTSPDDNRRRHEINKRAWAEAEDKAKFYFDRRRAELLEEAGLSLSPILQGRARGGPATRRREDRTRRFHEFVQSLLADDDIVTNDDFLDAIEPFLREPTTANRIVLVNALIKNPQWLGDRLAEFLKFA